MTTNILDKGQRLFEITQEIIQVYQAKPPHEGHVMKWNEVKNEKMFGGEDGASVCEQWAAIEVAFLAKIARDNG